MKMQLRHSGAAGSAVVLAFASCRPATNGGCARSRDFWETWDNTTQLAAISPVDFVLNRFANQLFPASNQRGCHLSHHSDGRIGILRCCILPSTFPDVLLANTII